MIAKKCQKCIPGGLYIYTSTDICNPKRIRWPHPLRNHRQPRKYFTFFVFCHTLTTRQPNGHHRHCQNVL